MDCTSYLGSRLGGLCKINVAKLSTVYVSGTLFLVLYRVSPDASYREQPKFIVFYIALITLFTMFCFKCKADKPKVSAERNGTMVRVVQHCHKCKKNNTWQSQPFVLGRYPAGNILLSFAALMAGSSISKLLLVFKHMGLCAFDSRTYFYHQCRFLFPSILTYWERYRSSLITKIKDMKDAVWSGDGRFDSMGHSAKYGVYTLLCSPIMKIFHFELLQVHCILRPNNH